MSKKKPIDVTRLPELAETDTNLPEACLDYLGIEYTDSETDVESHIAKHYQQRLRTGRSVIVKFTSVDYADDDEDVLEIEATVNYANFPYEDPSEILSGLRLKDSSGSSSGSFVKAIPIDRTGEPLMENPELKLGDCPTLTIQSIDISGDDSDEWNGPVSGTITLQGLTYYEDSTEFLSGQPPVELGGGESASELSEGDLYILDPSPSDYTAESAFYALRNPEYSDMNSFLDDLIAGDTENESTAFDQGRVEEFIDWTEQDTHDLFGLNTEQAGFTGDVRHEISLLQGPPGTGKTSGAVAPAIVARLLGYDGTGPCRTLVTGASNKSINEVMEKVVDIVDAYNADITTGDALEDVLFLRVIEPPETDADAPVDHEDINSEIAYTAFYGGEPEEQWLPAVKRRLTPQNLSDVDAEHIVVFATPRRAWRVGKSVISNFKLQSSETDPSGKVPGPDARPYELAEYGLFDVLVADEASMMNLPQFLLAGTFYDRGGNILLSGDHRQLPPVQQHDWQNEFRPSVTELAPYLSVLNFFRMLKGEDLQVLDDEIQDLISLHTENIPDIPLHQLEETHRCHERIAEFLREWVYWKLDRLDYRSNVTDVMDAPNPSTDGIATALEPTTPLVVITYDDTSSQQANPLEAKLATELLRSIDRDTTDTGIVTPHNAQRGLLNTRISESMPGPNSTDVDTVERFQGGERDMIILSGTVSDPDYVAAESEFLLNLNRLNVAMSRMKKKLVVIASESIFDHIPLDVDEYNEALLWKGLAKEAGLADDDREPDWNGSVTEFTGLAQSEFTDETVDTEVSVYCF